MRHTIYSSKLTNGSTLHFVNMPDSTLIEARIYFDAGFENFTADSHQVPHILEHLLIANGGEYNTEQKLLHAIQDLGANINASTDYEHITVWLRAPQKSFLAALKIVFDCVFNAQITQEALDREREIVLREIHEQFDGMGPRVINDALGKVFTNMVPANWEQYLTDTAGYELQVIRQAYNSFIRPNRMRVQIAGKLDSKKQSKIMEMFEALPASPEPLTPRTSQADFDNEGLMPIATDMDGGAGLTMLFFSPIHPEETRKQLAAYNFAQQLLFDAPSAIAPLQLRHQGVVYSITTDHIVLTDWRVFVITVLTDSDKAPLAVAEIIKYLHLYGNGHIPQEEMQSVKNYVDGLIGMSTETVSDIISWYSGDVLRDRPFMSIDEELQIVKELSVGDVSAAIRTLFIDAKLQGAVAVDDADTWVEYASALPKKISDESNEQKLNKIIAHEFVQISEMRNKAKGQLVGLGWAFYWVISFAVWLSVIWVSQLPVKGAEGTVSVFEYATEYNLVWGLCFFVPFLIGGALTWVRGQKEQVAEYMAVLLYFVSALVYAYGVYAHFGDIGIDAQPWYEDITSIMQPLFFYIMAPIASVAAVRRWLKMRTDSLKGK